jgi:hypothetical protein
MVREKELSKKFAENARMGLTLMVTAIAGADRSNSVQFAEGVSRASFRGDA